MRWTWPTYAPVAQTASGDGFYNLKVFSSRPVTAGLYTLFLQISATDATTNTNLSDIFSFDLNVIDPCKETQLRVNDTVIEDMVYVIGNPKQTQSFAPITDTISGNVTTSGTCGSIVYTLANNDTVIGTPFVSVINLLNAKGI